MKVLGRGKRMEIWVWTLLSATSLTIALTYVPRVLPQQTDLHLDFYTQGVELNRGPSKGGLGNKGTLSCSVPVRVSTCPPHEL